MAKQQDSASEPVDLELDQDSSAEELAEEIDELADNLGIDQKDAEMQVIEDEDGGAIINFEEKKPPRRDPDFYENLAEELDDDVLATIVEQQLKLIDMDIKSREKRDERIQRGLEKTGLGEASPGGADFDGASKVDHPLLAEANVDFTARVMKELFPPSGAVKSKIVSDKEDSYNRAQRKTQFLNWQTIGPNPQIEEYVDEHEAMISQLGIGGTQYIKWRYDPDNKRPGCEWIPREQVFKPYSATNFYTSPRVTYQEEITEDTLMMRVDQGLYVDDDALYAPSMMPDDQPSAQEAKNRIEGKEPNDMNLDGLRTIYNEYVWLRIEDDPVTKGARAPYYLIIDKVTRKCLGLYRNWESNDSSFKKLDWIVEYKFIPFGSDAIGFVELIGNLTTAATGALRALLDSAHFANFPVFAKLKSPGASGESLAPEPGQITEIEATGTVDDVRKLFTAIQYNPPSPVLFQLLGFLQDSAKGVVTTAEEKIQDAGNQMPVGTALALIDQGSKVFSSIHARLHRAQAKSLQILSRINYWYLDEMENQCGTAVSIKDFNENTDIEPVSDPNIFSEAQRVAQAQLLIQLSGTARNPSLYNERAIHKRFLEMVKIPNIEEILPSPAGLKESNPVLENVSMAMGQPCQAFPDQDHLAHLFVHLSFAKDPNLGGSPIIGPTFAPKLLDHIKQHVVLYYLQSIKNEVIKHEGEDIFELNAESPLSLLEQRAISATVVNVSADIASGLSQFSQEIQELVQKVQKAAQSARENLAASDPSASVILKTETARLQAETQFKQQDMQLRMKDQENKFQEAVAKLQTQVTEMEAKYRLQQEIDANQNAAKVAIVAMQNESKERIEEAKLGMQMDQAQQQLHAEQTKVAIDAVSKAHQAINQSGLDLAQGMIPEAPPELEALQGLGGPPEEQAAPVPKAQQFLQQQQGAMPPQPPEGVI